MCHRLKREHSINGREEGKLTVLHFPTTKNDPNLYLGLSTSREIDENCTRRFFLKT